MHTLGTVLIMKKFNRGVVNVIDLSFENKNFPRIDHFSSFMQNGIFIANGYVMIFLDFNCVVFLGGSTVIKF